METLLAEVANTVTVSQGAVSRPTGTPVDDLTNLNCSSGTPVPINSTVSPPEGILLPRININNSSDNNCDNGKSFPQTQVINTTNSSKSPILKKTIFKTPQPTYKFIEKDLTDSCSSSSGECDYPVIFANVMNEQSSDYDLNGYLDFDFLVDKVIPNEIGDISDKFCTITDLGKDNITFFSEEKMREKQNSQNRPICSYT